MADLDNTHYNNQSNATVRSWLYKATDFHYTIYIYIYVINNEKKNNLNYRIEKLYCKSFLLPYSANNKFNYMMYVRSV